MKISRFISASMALLLGGACLAWAGAGPLPSAVPEPATVALVGGAAAVLIVAQRLRKNRNK